MTISRQWVAAFGAAVGLAACSSFSCVDYAVARMEFDSVTGFDTTVGEPPAFEYHKEMLRWPWTVRWLEGTGLDWFLAALGAAPSLTPVENPAEVVRTRITCMVEIADGDFGKMADVALRLLWIAQHDDRPFDQMVAIDGMAVLLAQMHVDPLSVPGLTRDLERIRTALGRLEAFAPTRRGDRQLTALEHLGYLADLEIVSAQPSISPDLDRRTIRTLLAAAVTETGTERLVATRRALVDAMAGSMSQAIRVKLAAPAAEVREASLLAQYRLSGPVAVPWALRVVNRRNVDGMGKYDPSTIVRRTLVRLCADLPREYLLYASFERGPRPIEFLYDVATTDFDPGLRLLALDIAAQQLGHAADADPTWFDAWWREYSLDRSTGGDR